MSSQHENHDEVIAQKWLKAQGYGDIRNQCNDPPDFVVDGKLAVEVTRLSQRINGNSDNLSIEQRQRPLAKWIPPFHSEVQHMMGCGHVFLDA